jgi:predicted dithiol-disulfide oxidoreductase (DUF899 family)
MTQTPALTPARELAALTQRRFPNETPAYRAARIALLEQELELRRLTERVAEQRRALPLGGEVPEDYRFEGENGPVTLSQLFGRHDTLITYSWMFGPQRERPCPMCTCLLGAINGEVPDILQRVALVIVARSPIERLTAFKQERGWRYLPVVSSGGNTFNRDYIEEDPVKGEDNAGFNVFVKRDGRIIHTCGDEIGPEMADPGQDPRGGVEMMPLWTLLDLTPGGRGTDWYPKLAY